MTRAELHHKAQAAKALLANGVPMAAAAQQVGLGYNTLRVHAARGGWLRSSRREAYSPAVRVEALTLYAANGSMTRTSRVLGIARRTLMRWIRSATPHVAIATSPVVWRCYTCAEHGRRVEGEDCPGCGTKAPWAEAA